MGLFTTEKSALKIMFTAEFELLREREFYEFFESYKSGLTNGFNYNFERWANTMTDLEYVKDPLIELTIKVKYLASRIGYALGVLICHLQKYDTYYNDRNVDIIIKGIKVFKAIPGFDTSVISKRIKNIDLSQLKGEKGKINFRRVLKALA